MTELQIKYQQLELDRQRVHGELEIAQGQLAEAQRHNVASEAVAQEQARIAQHQADSARMNAETNRLNYGVNYMNAQSNARNADTNRMNAETNRLNYQVNARNAEINAMNAATNARNAAVNERQVALAEAYQPYQITALQAEADYKRAQSKDLQDKSAAGYWGSQSYRNYMGSLDSTAVSSATRLITGAAASAAAGKAASAVAAGKAASTAIASKTSNLPAPAGGSSVALNPAFLGVMYDGIYLPGTTSPLKDFINWVDSGQHIPYEPDPNALKLVRKWMKDNPDVVRSKGLRISEDADGNIVVLHGGSGGTY
jgi:hypothetical protein